MRRFSILIVALIIFSQISFSEKVTKNIHIGFESYYSNIESDYSNKSDSYIAAFLNSGWGIKLYNLSETSDLDSRLIFMKKGILSGMLDYEIGIYDIVLKNHSNTPIFCGLSYNIYKDAAFQLSLNLHTYENIMVSSIRIGIGIDN